MNGTQIFADLAENFGLIKTDFLAFGKMIKMQVYENHIAESDI